MTTPDKNIFLITGFTFTAELEISNLTHKVTRAAPCISWLTNVDRFQLFRICSQREWHIALQLQPTRTHHEQLEQTILEGSNLSPELKAEG
jgi:hypothetical protein